MKPHFLRAALAQWLPGVLLLFTFSASARLEVGQLRCEYLETPLGVDVAQPRLSWVLLSHERGVQQTAFQVLVVRHGAG